MITNTQGEILAPSIEKLFKKIPLTPQDIFVDLGSGRGQITRQVFLQTEVKEAWGIECLEALHLEAIKEVPLREGRKLNFILADFLNYPLMGATVALINSVCFSQKILNPLGEIINQTETIKTVCTTRPIMTLTRLRFIKTIRVECSWDSALCYIYQ